jgi:hypothetical protein
MISLDFRNNCVRLTYLYFGYIVQNPVGRIVNRFSKDQALVDELLPSTAQVRSLACVYEGALSCLGN